MLWDVKALVMLECVWHLQYFCIRISANNFRVLDTRNIRIRVLVLTRLMQTIPHVFVFMLLKRFVEQRSSRDDF